MGRLFLAECLKLKRYRLLWAGAALMLLSVALTLFTSLANDGSYWDFTYLAEQVIKNNTTMTFPMCITMLVGFLADRERSDDTLKNILVVPVYFRRLLAAKLLTGGVLAVALGLASSVFTLLAQALVGFPGFSWTLAAKMGAQITAVNALLYVAVLPIIACTAGRAGRFLAGVIVALVYGYGSLFATANTLLLNVYPINAALGVVGYRSDDPAVHWQPALCLASLALCVLVAIGFVACMKDTETAPRKEKAQKKPPKKGW